MEIVKNEYITADGLRVSSPLPGVIRVTDGKHGHSYAVSAKLRKIAPKVAEGMLSWGKITLDPENGMKLYYDGKLLSENFTGERKQKAAMTQEQKDLAAAEGHAVKSSGEEWPVEVIRTISADAAVYGLGDKTGFLNKRGYAYTNWCTDDPSPHVDHFTRLYKSINFFMVLSDAGCCGYFADNTYRSRFDFDKEQQGYVYFAHKDGALDYYMLPGKDIKEVLKKYHALTGTSNLQQKWVYGFHQSHWGYRSADEIRSVVDTYRENHIPMDAIHMDIDYMDGYRVFTFHPDNFPDPKGLTEYLASQGVQAVTIIDPGVKEDPGYFMYDEGVAQDHFAKNPDGSIYVGKVWPGAAVFPDFSREETRQWWGEKLKILMDAGVRGIWNDMNEPANFTGPLPDDVQFRDGDHLAMHNVYGHLMAQATYEGLLKVDGRRPFVLTRACFAGSQRYCSGWTGDNHAMWAHLQMSMAQMMNLGLSGMNLTGADVGGFSADCTPEMLIRWAQLGAVSPFFRNHYSNSARPHEFYAFDQATTDACRKAVQLRYHLLPYIYDVAHSDLPMVRPLVMEFPEDPNCRSITNQMMLGDKLMAAPILDPGVRARAVYLPAGTWYDYYTGKRYTGGKQILVEAPLDRMPLFARAGAAIPVSVGDPQSTAEITQVVLEVFPGTGSFVHYTDDGESMDYRQGGYHALKVQVKGKNVIQSVVHDGYEAPDQLDVIWKA